MVDLMIMSSFTNSPQRSKSTSAEQSVEYRGNDGGIIPANAGTAAGTSSHVNSSSAAGRKKRTTSASRRKQQDQLKQQELAEEPPDEYTRTTVEKMRSLMQATQPKLPITKVIELVGIPTNKFYELRKRYLPGVYRTASSKKHRMNSEEEQVAVKKIRALIQESPHATMQEIIKRVGLPTTKFYDLRRRFLSHMFDGSSKRKASNGRTRSKPPSQQSSENVNPDDEEEDEEEGSTDSSASSEAAVNSTLPSITVTTNNLTYISNPDTFTAATGLIMSSSQPQTSSVFSCIPTTHAAANFITSMAGEVPGRIKVEPFVGTLLPTMHMPTSMNAAIPFMHDPFGNLTAMHPISTADFQQQQHQVVSMHPYWAYTSAMLPDKQH